jgi:hypothetical protein
MKADIPKSSAYNIKKTVGEIEIEKASLFLPDSDSLQ